MQHPKKDVIIFLVDPKIREDILRVTRERFPSLEIYGKKSCYVVRIKFERLKIHFKGLSAL